jgi:putative MATE family efflux protein
MKDLTTGKESRLIFSFAIPMILGNIFQQLYHIIDSVIVGQYLGKEALAAVGASFPIIFVLISLVIGVSSGGTVIISQYFGAKDMNNVKRTIDTVFLFLLISSVIISVVGIIFSKEILMLVRVPAEILPKAVLFLQIFLIGLIPGFGFNGITAVLRGMGDSKTPLFFLIFSTILNIMLDFLFILVFKWGIAGAAIGSVISISAAFISIVVYLNKSHEVLRIRYRKMVFDREIFNKSIKIGLPTGLQQTFVSLGMTALLTIVNGFGTNVIAAYSVAGRIDSLVSLPAMNFAMALSAFVGQNIGAQKNERIKNGLLATLKMSSLIAVIFSIAAVFFGHQLVHIFTSDEAVVKIGQEYLIIVGSFYLVFNTMFIIGGIMRGAGDTFIPMLLSLFSLWIIRVPLAYFLSKYFNETGIWWSIPAAWVVGTCSTFIYYKAGRWKKKAVIGQRKNIEVL